MSVLSYSSQRLLDNVMNAVNCHLIFTFSEELQSGFTAELIELSEPLRRKAQGADPNVRLARI